MVKVVNFMSCIFSHNKEIKKEQVDKTGIRGGMVPILLCVSDFPDDEDSTPDLSWYIHNYYGLRKRAS